MSHKHRVRALDACPINTESGEDETSVGHGSKWGRDERGIRKGYSGVGGRGRKRLFWDRKGYGVVEEETSLGHGREWR